MSKASDFEKCFLVAPSFWRLRLYEYSSCVCVRLSVCVCVCLLLTYLAYKSWTDEWILTILTYIIDINQTSKLTKGQGHKVKGQGHKGIYVQT